MARPKAGEIDKSQAVRDYIATHKRAKAATVVAALAEKGIEVPASLVYSIRGKNRTKRGTLKTGRRPQDQPWPQDLVQQRIGVAGVVDRRQDVGG